jgi:hypothetical protein
LCFRDDDESESCGLRDEESEFLDGIFFEVDFFGDVSVGFFLRFGNCVSVHDLAAQCDAGRSGAKRGGAERSGAERSDGARPKGFVEQPELEALSLLMEMRKGNTLQTPATPATRGLSPPNVPN